jgi:hypothetical protein
MGSHTASQRFLPDPQLLNLTYIIEGHVQNLVELCSASATDQTFQSTTLVTLQSFYALPNFSNPIVIAHT